MMVTGICFVMFVFCSWFLSLQVWWFLSFVWWSSWTALLNMTTGKSMLSSSWFAKTCFSASWWRLRSWPWATPTAQQRKHKVFSHLLLLPVPQACRDLRKSMCPEIILQTGIGGEWSHLASFPNSRQQNVSWRILFSGCFGKHLTSTSRAQNHFILPFAFQSGHHRGCFFVFCFLHW